MSKRHTTLLGLAALALLVPLSACSANGFSGDAGTQELVNSAPDGPSGDAPSEAQEGGAEAGEGQAEQSVITTAEVSIVVDDPVASAANVRAVAESLKGFVESETVVNAAEGQSQSAQLVLRVPAEDVDKAFDELAAVGEVVSQSRAAQDVTAEYVDLEARIGALETSVKRLSDLMAGASSTSELLEAEAILSERQQELDGLKAQLEALSGQVDYATISVYLSTENTLPGGGPSNFFEGLTSGFDSLGAAGSAALVLLGVLLPWALIAAIITVGIVWLVKRARRRRAQRRASAQQSANASAAASNEAAPNEAAEGAPEVSAPTQP